MNIGKLRNIAASIPMPVESSQPLRGHLTMRPSFAPRWHIGQRLQSGPPAAFGSPPRALLTVCSIVRNAWNTGATFLVIGARVARRLEAAMKTALQGLTGVALCGVVVSVVIPIKLDAEQLRFDNLNGLCAPVASLADHAGGVDAAQVDTPCVIDMSHALPDTWGTLPPPVDLFERLPAPAPPIDKHDLPDPTFGPISHTMTA
jgi:hypothetical protein